MDGPRLNPRIRTPFPLLFAVFMLSAFVSLAADIGPFVIHLPYVGILPLAAAYMLASGRKSPYYDTRRESLWFALIVAAQFVSAGLSDDPSVAVRSSLYVVYFWATYALTRALLGRRLLTESEFFGTALLIFSALAMVSAAQYVTGSAVGLLADSLGESKNAAVMYEGKFRISGPLASPNVFAIVLQFFAALVCAGILRNERLKYRLFWAGLLTAFTVLIIVGSLSRSGLLFSFLSFFVVYASWLHSRLGRSGFTDAILATAIVSVLLLFVGYEVVSHRAEYERLSDAGTILEESGPRVEMAQAALFLANDPSASIFGVGDGQFFAELAERGVYLNYLSWLNPENARVSPHNWILQVLIENGVFALMGWVFLIHTLFLSHRRAGGWDKSWRASHLSAQILILFLSALQLDTSLKNPAVLTLIAISGAYTLHEHALRRHARARALYQRASDRNAEVAARHHASDAQRAGRFRHGGAPAAHGRLRT